MEFVNSALSFMLPINKKRGDALVGCIPAL